MKKALRVRIYSPYFPYPITEGAYQVIFDQAFTLSKTANVELVTWKESEHSIEKKIRNQDPFEGRVKVVCWGGHLPTAVKAAQKESSIRRLFRTAGSLVSRDSSPGRFYYPPAMDCRAVLQPCDLAIYHYTFAWTWLSRERTGQPVQENKRALYFHNLESDLFDFRAQRETNSIFRWIHRKNANKLRMHEVELARLVDELWFISEPDIQGYQKLVHPGNFRGLVRPPTYQSSLLESRSNEFRSFIHEKGSTEPVLGFVGALDFDPNRASLEYILDSVCPILEERRWKGKLLIVGKNPSNEVLQKMKARKHIEYLGFLPDISYFWRQLSMMLVPHLEGSGVRIKLLDALASGIPVLANSAAVERIAPSLLGSPLLRVEDDPVRWAEIILGLQGHELRKTLMGGPLLPGLQGEVVYRDILGL